MHTLWKDLLFLHGHVSQPSVLAPPVPERALASLLPREPDEVAAVDAHAGAGKTPPIVWRECA